MAIVAYSKGQTITARFGLSEGEYPVKTAPSKRKVRYYGRPSTEVW